MGDSTADPQTRKDLLKHMILQLHAGEAPQQVKARLAEVLKSIPYDEVVEVEQQLIAEGLPAEEVLKLCDIHGQVLEGAIDQTNAKPVPPGHPVDVLRHENTALAAQAAAIDTVLARADMLADADVAAWLAQLHGGFNLLADVDKHYKRKEYLVFPFLEAHGITGPPKVMWGKHDETRALLKAALEAVRAEGPVSADEARTLAELVFRPAVAAVTGMIPKEDEILLPMCMDTLSEAEWYAVDRQTMEVGYCLYDPPARWTPSGGIPADAAPETAGGAIPLSTGKLAPAELEAILHALPCDITFVDANDKVKFFSHGAVPVFPRNRAILGRDVRLCHPPASVHVVEQILDDFKSGRETRAVFWIQLHGKFVHIEYAALRDEAGAYLGTVEYMQDATALRALSGEQRLLSYGTKGG